MSILHPMYGMVILTLATTPLVYFTRVRAIRSGRMNRDSLKLFDAAKAPAEVTKATRHLANLFELPVLFYVACLTAYMLQLGQTSLLVLGWAYVALRTVHSVILLTYNDVVHRTRIHLLSNFALYTMWIIIMVGSISR